MTPIVAGVLGFAAGVVAFVIVSNFIAAWRAGLARRKGDK